MPFKFTTGMVPKQSSPIGDAGGLGKILAWILTIAAAIGLGSVVGAGTAQFARALGSSERVARLAGGASSFAAGGPLGVAGYAVVSGYVPLGRASRTGGGF